MAARYYLSKIVGTGALPSPENPQGDPYRSKAADYGVNHVCVIASDPDTGAPLTSSCLVLINAADFSAIDADPDLDFVSAAVNPEPEAGATIAVIDASPEQIADIAVDKYGGDIISKVDAADSLENVEIIDPVNLAVKHFNVEINQDNVVAQLGKLCDPEYIEGSLGVG